MPTLMRTLGHVAAILGDNVEAHVSRFWLGTCKWWPFAPSKNGEDEWGYEFMLGLIRKCLLLNSIYITGAMKQK